MNSCLYAYKRVMNNTMFKLLALLLTTATLNAAVAGDIRLRLPPLPPGIQNKASVAASQQAIRSIVEPGVTRAVQAGGSDSESIAYYFRGILTVFCGMSTNGNFTTEYVIAEIDKLPAPLIADTYFLDVKTSIVSAYKLAYADRTRAEVSPLDWLKSIAETFCSSIKEGIRHGGKGAVL